MNLENFVERVKRLWPEIDELTLDRMRTAYRCGYLDGEMKALTDAKKICEEVTNEENQRRDSSRHF